MSCFAFTVREAHWQTDVELLRSVRQTVFVMEQRVPASLEFDPDDILHQHVIAIDAQGDPIGTGRLSATGKIGRMAVMKHARCNGVGSAMLDALVVLAKDRGLPAVALSSQLHALPFYRRHGFQEQGDTYIEAGIPHQSMTRSIQ